MITGLAEVNWDTFSTMGKFMLGMIGILLIIFLIAVLTPKMAKFVDKLFSKADTEKLKSPARVCDKDGKVIYEVKDIYEETPEDNTDDKPEDSGSDKKE